MGVSVGWRQIVLVYVAAAVLASWYLSDGWRPHHDREAAPARSRVFTRDLADADELRMARGGVRLVAHREQGRWEIREPAGAEVSSDLLTALVEALGSAEVIQEIGEPGTDRSAFGLDEETVTIEIGARGATPSGLRLGAVNPGGTAVYAQRTDSRAVVLIGRNVRYYEELVFDALGAGHAPVIDTAQPVGG